MNFVKIITKKIFLTFFLTIFIGGPLTVVHSQQIGTTSAFGTVSGGVSFGGTFANILSCSGVTPGQIVDVVGSTVSSLFGAGGDVADNVDGGTTPVGGAIDTTTDLLDGDIGGAAQNAGEVAAETTALALPGTPAADAGVRQLLIQLKNKVGDVEEENEKVVDQTKWQVFKENCLDKIVREMAVRTLNRLTLSTVEFINSGFKDEEAFFLANPDEFFSDLVKDEFYASFDELVVNDELQPFGTTIIATLTDTVRRKLQQNATLSMQAVLNGYGYPQWEADFSVGGWSAYTTFVEPNNNIFGTYLTASDVISRRTAGSYMSVPLSARAELQSGLGFMSQKECVATLAGPNYSYVDASHPLHFPEGTGFIQQVSDIPPDKLTYIEDELTEYFEEDQIAIAEQYRKRSICTQWKTLTPGNWIANSLNSATTDTTRNQLISADEWNENLGLIFDALILQAFNGISNLYSPDGNYSTNPNDPNYNAAYAAENDPNFGNSYNQGGGNNPGYFSAGNISEIINTQEEYQAVLATMIETLNLLIERTRELDYCVPGPFPTWSSAITTLVNNGLFSFSEPPANYSQSERQQYFADLFEEVTGVTLNPEEADITTSGELSALLGNILSQYTQKINQAYTNTNIPSNRSVAASYFNLVLDTYIPALEGFNTENVYIQQNIETLQALDSQIESLINNNQLTSAAEQQIMSQVQNLPYLITPNDLTNLEQMLAGTQGLVDGVTTQRGICIAEVSSPNYQGLNYRKEYQYQLSSFVDVLPEHDTFLEDVQIGLGPDDIYPSILPGSALVGGSDLQVFEDFLGPLF